MRLDNKAGPRMCIACRAIVTQYDTHHILYAERDCKRMGIQISQQDWLCILCIPCHGQITSRNAKQRKTGKSRYEIWQEFLNDKLGECSNEKPADSGTIEPASLIGRADVEKGALPREFDARPTFLRSQRPPSRVAYPTPLSVEVHLA